MTAFPDLLFRHRGAVLALPALLALAAGRPGAATIALAMPWLLGGLALRAWAFSWLGGEGRTRDPGPPRRRVRGGPFPWLAHPVYLGNVAVAAGMAVAARPAGWVAAGLLGLVTALYAVLAGREDRLLRGIVARQGRPAGFRLVARWERSTWAAVGVFLLLAAR